LKNNRHLYSKYKIRVAEPSITEEDAVSMYESVKNVFLSSGPNVEKFEKSFADYIGIKNAIAVNSGTAALHLALESLDIKNGDEVITTPFTFAATSNVIVLQNAVPVFVDIEQQTFNLEPKKIENAITTKTKAIMPIHYAGQCADMDEINEIAQKHNLHVIEDAVGIKGKLIDYIGNKMFAFLVNVFFGGRWTDSINESRIITRKAFNELKFDSFKMGSTQQMSIRGLKLNQKICEIVGNEGVRIGGKRKMAPLQAGADLSLQILTEFFHW